MRRVIDLLLCATPASLVIPRDVAPAHQGDLQLLGFANGSAQAPSATPDGEIPRG